MSSRLERLLRPGTIAVFGGQEAASVIEQCDKMGFAGEIWPVHPKREEIGGRRCYRSVAELPGAPDAAFIGVNRHLTVEIVGELARRGTGGAVCYASGFREAQGEIGDGASLQDALLAAAGEMPIIGPNCYGFINYLDGALLWPDQHGGVRRDKGVAILTQSSNIAINMTMQSRGLPIAYMVTAGNQAQTGLAEIANGLLEDPRVTALGLHIEGIGDVPAFEAMQSKARALGKPVVVLKVGRSEQAQAATLSHTASLAGSEAGATAFFERLGVPRLGSIPAFLESLKLLHLFGPLPGRELCSMSCSGGEASVMADTALNHAVSFRPLNEAERNRVKATLSDIVTVANPLDYHTFIWADVAAMSDTFSAMVGNGFDLSMLILDFPRKDRCADDDWDASIRALQSAAERTGGRVAAVSTLPETMPEARAEELMAKGILPGCGIDDTLSAVEAAATIGEAWARPEGQAVLALPESDGSSATLSEVDSKQALAPYGLCVPESRVVSSIEAAAEAGEALGYPLAVKALGIAHKSEAGAVRLGITDAAGLLDTAAALLPLGEGLLVERMVEDVVAELIIGVTRDPLYGLMMTIGAGGVLVELLGDAKSLLLPAGEAEIRAAICSLKTAPLLQGYRGRPVADLEAAVQAALAVARYAEDNAERLVELDVNPLMVRAEGQGAIAADALIRIGEECNE